jgi:hypothetical protein
MRKLWSIVRQTYLQTEEVNFESSVYCRSTDIGTVYQRVQCVSAYLVHFWYQSWQRTREDCRPTWVQRGVRHWRENKCTTISETSTLCQGLFCIRELNHTTPTKSGQIMTETNLYLLFSVGWDNVLCGLCLTIFCGDFKGIMPVMLQYY